MKIIIIGCGKVGSTLAEELCEEDHELTVIDKNPQKIQQICESIGADSLKYLSVEHLVESCKKSNLHFCLGCFTGSYPYPMDDYETDKLKFE